MKDKRFERIITAAKSVSLRQDEKDALRVRLMSFMKEHPVSAAPASLAAGVPSPFMAFFRRHVFAPVLVAFVIMIGAGGAIGAQGALPGDILYPVKLGDEHVQSLFAVGPAANARVETSQASERISEAQALAERGRLDLATQASLQQDLDAHVAVAASDLSALRQRGDEAQADAIGASFDASVRAGQDALASAAGVSVPIEPQMATVSFMTAARPVVSPAVPAVPVTPVAKFAAPLLIASSSGSGTVPSADSVPALTSAAALFAAHLRSLPSLTEPLSPALGAGGEVATSTPPQPSL